MFVSSIKIFRRCNSTITKQVNRKKIGKNCKNKISERIKLYEKIMCENKKNNKYNSLTNDIEYILHRMKF
jgi:hypothetical protein